MGRFTAIVLTAKTVAVEVPGVTVLSNVQTYTTVADLYDLRPEVLGCVAASFASIWTTMTSCRGINWTCLSSRAPPRIDLCSLCRAGCWMPPARQSCCAAAALHGAGQELSRLCPAGRVGLALENPLRYPNIVSKAASVFRELPALIDDELLPELVAVQVCRFLDGGYSALEVPETISIDGLIPD